MAVDWEQELSGVPAVDTKTDWESSLAGFDNHLQQRYETLVDEGRRMSGVKLSLTESLKQIQDYRSSHGNETLLGNDLPKELQSIAPTADRETFSARFKDAVGTDATDADWNEAQRQTAIFAYAKTDSPRVLAAVPAEIRQEVLARKKEINEGKPPQISNTNIPLAWVRGALSPLAKMAEVASISPTDRAFIKQAREAGQPEFGEGVASYPAKAASLAGMMLNPVAKAAPAIVPLEMAVQSGADTQDRLVTQGVDPKTAGYVGAGVGGFVGLVFSRVPKQILGGKEAESKLGQYLAEKFGSRFAGAAGNYATNVGKVGAETGFVNVTQAEAEEATKYATGVTNNPKFGKAFGKALLETAKGMGPIALLSAPQLLTAQSITAENRAPSRAEAKQLGMTPEESQSQDTRKAALAKLMEKAEQPPPEGRPPLTKAPPANVPGYEPPAPPHTDFREGDLVRSTDGSGEYGRVRQMPDGVLRVESDRGIEPMDPSRFTFISRTPHGGVIDQPPEPAEPAQPQPAEQPGPAATEPPAVAVKPTKKPLLKPKPQPEQTSAQETQEPKPAENVQKDQAVEGQVQTAAGKENVGQQADAVQPRKRLLTPSQIGKQNAAENRAKGVQDAQAGKITPEAIKHAPLHEMPEAFKLAMKQYAEGRLADEQRKSNPDKAKVTALQKIIDDAGSDVGSAVENLKEDIAKKGAGYQPPVRRDSGLGEQLRGGYKEKEDNRDPIIQAIVLDPDSRDQLLDKTIAAVRAGGTTPLADRIKELIGVPFDGPEDTVNLINTLRDKGHAEAQPEPAAESPVKPPQEANPLGSSAAPQVQKKMLDLGEKDAPGQQVLFNKEGSEPEREEFRASPGGGKNAAVGFEAAKAGTASGYGETKTSDRAGKRPVIKTRATIDPLDIVKKLGTSAATFTKGVQRSTRAAEVGKISEYSRQIDSALSDPNEPHGKARQLVDRMVNDAEVAFEKLPTSERQDIRDRAEKLEGKKLDTADPVHRAVAEVQRLQAEAFNNLRKVQQSLGKVVSLVPAFDIDNTEYLGRLYKGPKAAASAIENFLRGPQSREIRGKFGGKASAERERTYQYDAEVRKLREDLIGQADRAKQAGNADAEKQFRQKAAELEPVTDNEITLGKLKLAAIADRTQELTVLLRHKEAGLAQFKMTRMDAANGTRVPEGNHGPLSTFVVHAPPTMTIHEAYDALQVDRLMDFARGIGINAQRFVNLGQRLGDASTDMKTVRTKFGGPESVLAHEIGHILGYRYKLFDWMTEKPAGKEGKADRAERILIGKQLRDLADKRWEGQQASSGFKRYVRRGVEKEAALLEAYVHAPQVFEKEFPELFKSFERFLTVHKELSPLKEIKPSMVLGSETAEMDIPGERILGYYHLPNESATALEKMTSTGLDYWLNKQGGTGKVAGTVLKAADYATGKMMQSLLLGPRHAVTTTIMNLASDVNNAFQYAKGKEFKSAGKSLLRAAGTPFGVTPIRDILAAERMRSAISTPARDLTPDQKAMRDELFKSGFQTDSGRFDNEIKKIRMSFARVLRPDGTPFSKTVAAGGVAYHTPLAILEATAKPVMGWAESMKIAQLHEANLLSDMQLNKIPGITESQRIAAYQRNAADMDARFGQVTWENIPASRIVKDLLQKVFLSAGWKGGNAFAGFGAIADVAGAMRDVAMGRSRADRGQPWITNRMSFPIAATFTMALIGSVYQYLKTGQWPKDEKDALQPRNGTVNPDGSPGRVNFPWMGTDWRRYMDDPGNMIMSATRPDWHLVWDMAHNKDTFTGQQIHPENASAWKIFTDDLSHALDRMKPIGVQQYQRGEQEGKSTSDAIENLAGIAPARQTDSDTPAQALLHKYLAGKAPAGGKTPEEAAASDARRKYVSAVRGGKDADLPAGVTGASAKRLLKQASTSWMAGGFKGLSLDQAMDVFEVADEDERDKLRRELVVKFRNAAKGGKLNDTIINRYQKLFEETPQK